MPSRPDLREISSNVREAFTEADRETLLDILTFVIKEYVVEGPPPMMIHQAETLSDLQGASFAQLISAMQTRFEHPELAMFVVDGEQVSVRVGGVMQPLVAPRTPMGATAAELPRPAAGVRVLESNLQQRTPPPAPPGVQMVDTRPPPAAQQASTAPPPARGVSVRGREGAAPAPAPSAPQGAQPAAPPTAGQPAAPASDKPDAAGGDDASARFSLLELD
ncbi:MAG: hypothetical protein H0T42_11585 [Deltaproteobacteria bacterium]|nr:hypothetical protein [Deltaproteobacteria bacterium]